MAEVMVILRGNPDSWIGVNTYWAVAADEGSAIQKIEEYVRASGESTLSAEQLIHLGYFILKPQKVYGG